MRYYLATLIALIIFGVPAVTTHFSVQINEISYLLSQAGDQLAAVILSHNPKTIANIQASYYPPKSIENATSTKVKVLIVPGHESSYGGAEYKNLKERDMNLELANDLADFMQTDSHYEIFQTRDDTGWSSDFLTYFKNNWDAIVAWQKASKAETLYLSSTGVTTKATSVVVHNTAPKDVALRLYGITKWANENNVDITIHIHFNDDTEHRSNKPGKYSGFAIYVPDNQYGNSTTTRAIASAIFKRLAIENSVSNLPGESSGIVNEQDLIAIGADNTANSASMLIEYGYIYEKQFSDPKTRSLALKNFAYQTYLGLQDFFNSVSFI